MDGGDEQLGLRPRWLYICAGVVVVTAVGFFALVFFTVALLMYEMSDAMAGM